MFQTARSLKLKNLPEFSGMSGGRAIEQLARNGDPRAFDLVTVMTRRADCNFSFGGIKAAAKKIVQDEEEKYGNITNENWSQDNSFAEILAWYEKSLRLSDA